MSQRWKKSSRSKTRTPIARRAKVLRTLLNAVQLDDRIVPSSFTATNSTLILIPANTATGVGPASPDPSTINVSGLTGVVTSLTVTFNNLYHESADDVQALLLAPNGANIYLMANNGGTSQIGAPDNSPPSGINVTFDSSATTTIGSSGVGTGPYAPQNASLTGNTTSNLPPGTPPPVTTMGIGGFYGINPNGAWGLYIDDVNAFEVGAMGGGWTLTFNYRPNTAPVAVNDTYTTNENTTLTVNTSATGVLANDTDADGDPLTAHLVTGPANGSVTFNPDGTFTYVPNHYFSGTDTFTYKDDDGVVYGNTATVTVNVTHVNQPPIAVNDSYTLQNGGPQYVGPAFGVLANDIDPDGATPNYNYYSENFSELPLEAFPVGTGGANNTMTDWTPNMPAGWTRDNNPAAYPPWNQPTSPTDPGNVFDGWHVLNIDSWIAQQGDQDRSKFLNENQYPGFNAPNTGSHSPVLVADGDAYADFENIDTPAAHMSTYAYMPAIKLTGALDNTLKLNFDSSFRPEDPADGLQQGTVDVSFDGGNTWTNLLTMDNADGPNAPYPAGDESRINQQISLAVNNPAGATAMFRFGYLDAGNDWWWAVDNISVTAARTNPGAANLTATEVTGPTHGTLNFNADGSFTYTANPLGYTGPDSFTYDVSDGQYTAGPATVSIQVNANNTAPVAVNDSYTTPQGTPLTVGGAAGLLINDSDPDTGGFIGLTTSEITPPTHGTLTFNIDGSFSYSAPASFFGTDSFTYQDSDSVHSSNTATVTITVPQTNTHAPVANNDTYSLPENGSLTTTAANGVLANDTDADNNPLTAILETSPQHGTFTFNADGSFTYVPHQFYYGTDTFTYEAFDGLFASNIATVTLTVNQVNVAPVANPDAYATAAGTPLTTTAATGVLANDRDDGTITTLLTENFEELPLQPFPVGVHNAPTGNPNGDWTDSVPAGWTLNNAPPGLSATPPPSSPSDPGEIYYGWHVLDIDSWIHEQGDQDRSDFLNENKFPGYSQAAPNLVGSHDHVLVADGDGYQDYVPISPSNPMNTLFISPSISLAGLNQNSLTLEFDSSFRPEEAQEAKVEVSYDGGTTWTSLLDYTTANSGGSGALTHINEHLTLDANNPASATTAVFRFDYLGAGNDWWWAIDNIKVTGATPNAGATLTAALASQAHNGTVALNPNGSFTYTPNAGFTGLDSFTYTASDGVNTSAPATATILVGNSSLGVQVNDGSAQRSQVRSITVGFNGVATFAGNPAAAFQLAPVAGGTDVTLSASVTTVNGLTDVTLTFSGAGTDAGSNSTGGPLSLADGLYQLTVSSAQVSVNGQALDGDNNGTPGGDYVSPADTAGGGPGQLHLFRLFGDVNGDGFVNTPDLVAFRATIGSQLGDANYSAAVDYNADGFINTPDLVQFRSRIGNSVFP